MRWHSALLLPSVPNNGWRMTRQSCEAPLVLLAQAGTASRVPHLVRPITKLPHELIGSAPALLPMLGLEFALSIGAEFSGLARSARGERVAIRRLGDTSACDKVDSQLLSHLSRMQYGDCQDWPSLTAGRRGGKQKSASQDTIWLGRTRTSILVRSGWSQWWAGVCF